MRFFVSSLSIAITNDFENRYCSQSLYNGLYVLKTSIFLFSVNKWFSLFCKNNQSLKFVWFRESNLHFYEQNVIFLYGSLRRVKKIKNYKNHRKKIDIKSEKTNIMFVTIALICKHNHNNKQKLFSSYFLLILLIAFSSFSHEK